MPANRKLDRHALETALLALPAWTLKRGKLHRVYAFRDFREAFGFMTRIALFAERRNHHPEWFNVYKNVIVDLSTHEAAGITALDLALAREMERVAQQL